jgi:hypothetical protein
MNCLNELGLAIWVMDDGSTTINNLKICTCCFTYEENIMMRDWFKITVGVKCSVSYGGENEETGKPYYLLNFNTKETQSIFSLISPYIHPQIGYKMKKPRKHTNNKIENIRYGNIAYNDYSYGLVENSIVWNDSLFSTKTIEAIPRKLPKRFRPDKVKDTFKLHSSFGRQPTTNYRKRETTEAMKSSAKKMSGSNNGNSKYTESFVRNIIFFLPYKTNQQLGKMFGVSYQYIASIRKGLSWKHIPRESQLLLTYPEVNSTPQS